MTGENKKMTKQEELAQDSAENKDESIELNPADFKESSITGKFKKPNFDEKLVKIGMPTVKANPNIKQTLKNQKPYRDVYLQVPYFQEDLEIGHENYGGLRQYQNTNEEGVEVWTQPVFANPDGDSAAAVLFRKWYGQVKKMDKSEGGSITLEDFVTGLAGLVANLKHVTGKTGQNEWEKNVVSEFVGGSEEQAIEEEGA